MSREPRTQQEDKNRGDHTWRLLFITITDSFSFSWSVVSTIAFHICNRRTMLLMIRDSSRVCWCSWGLSCVLSVTIQGIETPLTYHCASNFWLCCCCCRCFVCSGPHQQPQSRAAIQRPNILFKLNGNCCIHSIAITPLFVPTSYLLPSCFFWWHPFSHPVRRYLPWFNF